MFAGRLCGRRSISATWVKLADPRHAAVQPGDKLGLYQIPCAGRRWRNGTRCTGFFRIVGVCWPITSAIRTPGGRSRRQPAAGAGTGRRHRAREEREVRIGVRSGEPAHSPPRPVLPNAPDITTTKACASAPSAPCRPAAPCASARWPRAPTGAVRADSRRRRRPLRRDAMFRIHYPPEERSSRLWPRHLPRFQARGTSLKTNPSRLARVAELPAIER